MTSPISTLVILLAAGSGTRFSNQNPKCFANLGNKCVLQTAIDSLDASDRITKILPVIKKDLFDYYYEKISACDKLLEPVTGGESRFASISNAINFIVENDIKPQIILIHDAARPIISTDLIRRVIDGAVDRGAAIPSLPLVDSTKEFDPETGTIKQTLPRSCLCRAQTPQAFDFEKYLKAHREALESDAHFEDDADVMLNAGYEVISVEGDAQTIKLTHPNDLEQLALIANSSQRVPKKLIHLLKAPHLLHHWLSFIFPKYYSKHNKFS